MTITDPGHLAAAKQLRERYLHPAQPAHTLDDELTRDLADYDGAFGLNTDREVA